MVKAVKAGFVAIVGRPNVGKSTLLNAIVGEKVSIVSKIPQTTRQRIRGVYQDERGQIVFIDTPGVHRGNDYLDEFMYQSSVKSITDVDALIYLVDTSRRIGEEEEIIAQQVKNSKVPIILGLNKVDLKGERIPDYIEFWEEIVGKKIQEIENLHLVSLSGKNKTNLDPLLEILFDALPEGEPLYPQDTVTDLPIKVAFADIIREKLFYLLKDEIPHAIEVKIEQMKPVKGNTEKIIATVIAERETQKQIIIGKNAELIKKAGTMAREDMEAILEKRVFLDLTVKTQKKWREDHYLLSDLGYDERNL